MNYLVISIIVIFQHNIGIDIVPKLCDVLGCTPNDLYGIANQQRRIEK